MKIKLLPRINLALAIFALLFSFVALRSVITFYLEDGWHRNRVMLVDDERVEVEEHLSSQIAMLILILFIASIFFMNYKALKPQNRKELPDHTQSG